MADEIEKHLVSQLKRAIAEVKAAAEQQLPAKLAHLSSKFDQVQKSLERSASGAPDLPKLSRPTLYTLSNLLSEWQIQSKKQTPYSLDSLFFIYKFASNLDKIKSELQLGDGAVITVSNGETSQPSSADQTEGIAWSNRSVDETKVHGLDDRVMSLQRILVPTKDDAGFKAIGIVGMRGVGKTTLCQLIFKEEGARKDKHFLPRIWVCASRSRGDDPDMRKEVVKRMLACLGVEDKIVEAAAESHDLKGLLFALRLELVGKKYLIVLDDVGIPDVRREEFCDFCSSLDRDEKCGEKLAYGLPKVYGGAVIVTSRSEDLGIKMVGEENLNRMLPILDDESCWKIFKESAGEDEKQWENLRGKIVEKCAGLPLAAKMMGRIARESVPKKPAPAPP